MVELYGRHWTRSELLERVGDVSQVGGARLVQLADGPGAGGAVAELRACSGVAVAVLAGGARLVQLADGPEAGVAVAELRTGSGFAFDVLPGRGMDIGFAEYRGMPLCWRSPTGEIAAAFYERADDGWLRGFSGGLMETCGVL